MCSKMHTFKQQNRAKNSFLRNTSYFFKFYWMNSREKTYGSYDMEWIKKLFCYFVTVILFSALLDCLRLSTLFRCSSPFYCIILAKVWVSGICSWKFQVSIISVSIDWNHLLLLQFSFRSISSSFLQLMYIERQSKFADEQCFVYPHSWFIHPSKKLISHTRYLANRDV